jgi:hypothetical protein
MAISFLSVFVSHRVTFLTYLSMFALAVLGVVSFFIQCPVCGKSVFIRKYFGLPLSMPWYSKERSRCGTNLAPDTRDTGANKTNTAAPPT